MYGMSDVELERVVGDAAGLQGELAVLERMLFELETETATLNQVEALQQQSVAASEVSFREDYSEEREQLDLAEDGEQSRSVLSSRGFASEDEYASGRGASDDDHNSSSEASEESVEDESFANQENRERDRLPQAPPAALHYASNGVIEHEASDVTLSQVCYKSLSIGVELAKRIEQVGGEWQRVGSLVCLLWLRCRF